MTQQQDNLRKDSGVILARTAGFCPGVKRAIDRVLELAQAGKPIYTLGPLIHNPQVIETLEEKNIVAVKSLSQIRHKNAVLVIRAHGVTPEVEAEIRASGLEVVDATCPLVKNAQAAVSRYAAQGYSTVIVGDAGHAEVCGLLGYAAGKGLAVADADEARALAAFEKVHVVAQTTQEEAVFLAAVSEIKKKSAVCAVSDTICRPTRERQRETAELARSVELMIVVGGKHSANTARLAKLCGGLCEKTILAETEEELDPKAVRSAASVGITAGASTPSWMTERVVNWVKNARKSAAPTVSERLEKIWALAINSCIYTAAAAVCLAYVCMRLEGAGVDGRLLTLSGLFVFSLSLLNRASEKGMGAYDRPKFLLFRKYRTATMVAAALAGLGAVLISLSLGAEIFGFVFFFWLLGATYPFRHALKLKTVMAFPGSKDVVTALGWGFVCAYLPAVCAREVLGKTGWLALGYAGLLVFARSAMLGISAVHTDLIVGRENFYKALGRKKTLAALSVIIAALACASALLLSVGWHWRLVLALLAGNLYAGACLALYFLSRVPKGIWADTLIDGQFIFLAALVFAAMRL